MNGFSPGLDFGMKKKDLLVINNVRQVSKFELHFRR